ncbi:SIR2 family protein [Apilactobacillus xinyiensis]|uniref:SIR2 family protein n=1 Tax=Apilactobacillus xinyiensis TaxID=2841032 RepID=UPI00201014EF|nr:SIR2 family protein [Apilactobacillus xinyiensis]MCL0330806.1 SIR2 family protein [Apilactobacillus xinyiensis]
MCINSEIVWLSNKIKLSKSDKENNLQFFKNNQEILSDGQEVEEEFNNLIKIETQKFINQNFDNIVVMVGAGASVTDNEFKTDENGIATSGVTVSKMANEILNKLKDGKYNFISNKNGETDNNIKDVFTLEEISRKSQYSSNILYDNDRNNNDEELLRLNNKFNLEDFLSNMFEYEHFVSEDKEKFNNTKEAILNIIIKSTSYNYDNKKFKHIKFLNILSKLVKSENKLNLVTTNYDTLLEDAAESMKWTIFDGFSFSQTPQFDSTMFDWNLTKEVSNVKTHEKIYKSNVANLLKIHGSVTWTKSNNNIVRKNKNSIKKPVMVFPSSNKYAKSYQEPYFDLFHKFQDLLHKPNTLLITTGFSFSDNHIARMIISAIKTNDSLSSLITNFHIDNNNSNKNWNELVEAMNDYYNVAFLKATLNSNLTEYLGGEYYEN